MWVVGGGRGVPHAHVPPLPHQQFTLNGTRETPPQPDLTAIENRTWLYRRPYTVLEIQHVHGLDAETHPPNHAGGFAGVTVSPCVPAIHVERLRLGST